MIITKKTHMKILKMMKDDVILQMQRAFREVVNDQRSTILRLQTENNVLKFDLMNAQALLPKKRRKK